MDAAAKEFSEAYDAGMIPMEFVNSMRKKGQLIMGIGHRVKSVKYTFGSYIRVIFVFAVCCLVHVDTYDHCTIQADDLLACLSSSVMLVRADIGIGTFSSLSVLNESNKTYDICLSVVTVEEYMFQVAADHFKLPVLLRTA